MLKMNWCEAALDNKKVLFDVLNILINLHKREIRKQNSLKGYCF